MLIFAHRGARDRAPENTMAAFQAGYDLGAAGIELDVQLSRDGEVVVIHDHTVDRTSNGHGRVADLSLAELKQLDFGAWFSPEFAGETIPTLDEVLAWLAPLPLIVNVEIKNTPIAYPGIEEKVAALLRRHLKDQVASRAAVSSFHHPCLRRLKAIAPEIPTALLFACHPIDPVRLAAEAGAAALHPNWECLDRSWVAKAQAAGLAVRAYTVNSEEAHRLAIAAGVDAIFTDHADKWCCR